MTEEQHRSAIHTFFRQSLEIDNVAAVDHLIAEGYDRLQKLGDVPPTRKDLDKLGFTMYERNVATAAFAKGVWFILDEICK